MRRIDLLAVAFLAAAVAPSTARTAEPPTPEALLAMLLDWPDVPYTGRVIVAHWNGKRSQAEEAAVFFRPPDLVRWDFFGPDGRVVRRVVADDRVERVIPVGGRAALSGSVEGSLPKALDDQRELELLRANYAAETLPSKTIAGRTSWGLCLTPKIAGKPTQNFWIDEQTQTLLKVRRFLPGEPFAVETLFTEFDPGREPPENAFATQPGAPARTRPNKTAPEFLSREEAIRKFGPKAPLPAETPEGFVFEGAEVSKMGGSTVLQAHYTDGLALLSYFVADRPIQLPRESEIRQKGAPDIHLTAQTHMIHWQKGGRHSVLMGDLSTPLLQKVADHFRNQK